MATSGRGQTVQWPPLSQEDHELKELEANLSYMRVCLSRARWEARTAIERTVLMLWGGHQRFHLDTVHSLFPHPESIPAGWTALRYQVLSTGFWNAETVSQHLTRQLQGQGPSREQFDGS